MKTETIVMCVVALILGMLMANMLENVCGCKVVEGSVKEFAGDVGDMAGGLLIDAAGVGIMGVSAATLQPEGEVAGGLTEVEGTGMAARGAYGVGHTVEDLAKSMIPSAFL